MATNDDVRMANIKLRQAQTAADGLDDDTFKNSYAAKINELAYYFSLNSETATDLTLTPAASVTVTQLLTAGSGATGTSTKAFKVPKQYLDEMAIVKLVVTGGAGGTVTWTIQGSTDAAFTSPVTLYSADSAAPVTFTNTDIVVACVSTTVTKVRFLKPLQKYAYVRVIWSAGTTNTAMAVDLWYGGGAGSLV